MCGRTVQTVGAVYAASKSLLKTNSSTYQGGLIDKIGPRETTASSKNDDKNINSCKNNDDVSSPSKKTTTNNDDDASATTIQTTELDNDDDVSSSGGVYPWRDNFNLSPGHDAVVFTINRQTGELQMDRKVWGLVTRGGTKNQPLQEGPSKHFQNLMFNARCDTLYSKPTFAKLLNQNLGRTCLVAFDGFFEWKSDTLPAGKGKKQPFFVFRRNNNNKNDKSEQSRPYLLMAGLWTSVPTGYSLPKPSTLSTFTLLTTEVCTPLKWLHSRMPVCVWDEELAMKWLQEPSPKLLNRLDHGANHSQETVLQWHAVSTQMSSTKFRSSDSIKAIPKERSVKSFFAPAAAMGKRNSSSGSSGSNSQDLLNTKAKKEDQKKAATETTNSTDTANILSGTKRYPTASNSSTAENSPSPNKSKRQKNNPKLPKKGTITAFFTTVKKPGSRK